MFFNNMLVSSPRPWRCFLPDRAGGHAAAVFSTPVEVFLRRWRLRNSDYCLLHARGGVSENASGAAGEFESSPRPWRCFHYEIPRDKRRDVFSTPVEVFLMLSGALISLLSLLHARGGVSGPQHRENAIRRSSPRPWRCFSMVNAGSHDKKVFSTPVEVFHACWRATAPCMGLLHARGGVSGSTTPVVGWMASSPRPWRCFPIRR